jgi:hypothetical protein
MVAKAASMSARRQHFMHYLHRKIFVENAIGVSLSSLTHGNPLSAAAIYCKFST